MQYCKMKKEPIILIGAGGHCISCIDVIESTEKYNIIGILDHPEKRGTKVLEYPIIGSDDDIPELIKSCKNFLITVGQIKSPKIRQNIYKIVKESGGLLPVVISPSAYVSQHSRIEEGTIVMHHVMINAAASAGICCIINSKALIEHEASIGDFCHISTAACINGQVTVGANTFIGSNTVVGNNLTVSENVIIAAGSQVLKSICRPGIYIGNPLRKIR